MFLTASWYGGNIRLIASCCPFFGHETIYLAFPGDRSESFFADWQSREISYLANQAKPIEETRLEVIRLCARHSMQVKSIGVESFVFVGSGQRRRLRPSSSTVNISCWPASNSIDRRSKTNQRQCRFWLDDVVVATAGDGVSFRWLRIRSRDCWFLIEMGLDVRLLSVALSFGPISIPSILFIRSFSSRFRLINIWLYHSYVGLQNTAKVSKVKWKIQPFRVVEPTKPFR